METFKLEFRLRKKIVLDVAQVMHEKEKYYTRRIAIDHKLIKFGE